jgi:4-amino-4-deoxy-L-arabinose transferase-like glycosyltransferase
MKIGVTDALVTFSVAAIVYGFSLMYAPAGWIVGGLFGLVSALAIEYTGSRRGDS